MATIVCQGLQSCLHEPQLVEPRTLRLKLSSPVPHHLFSASPLELGGFKSFLSSESNHIKELSHEEKCHSEKPATKNSDLGGWSFLQSISSNNTSQQYNPPTPVYNKRSSSATRLSEKSLELCTENLGNETGTMFIENGIFESNDNSVAKRDQQKQSKSLRGKKSATVRNFPPPLTTISGSDSLQVRPHREDGRLILKAVKAPLPHNCFHAERSNGRLRLGFSKDFFAPNFDSESPTTTANQEDIEANSGEDNENEGYKNERDEEQEEQEVGDVDKHVLREQGRMCLVAESEENTLKVGGEEGMEKFERPSRCKEGGDHEKKGLLNFEHLNWVAT